MATLATLLKVIGRQTRRITNGVLLLLDRPRELPHNVSLLTRHLWNVHLWRRGIVVIERSGGIGDLTCLLASIPGLRDRHPRSWLVVICPPGCRRLAESSGLFDAGTEAGSFFHRFASKTCLPSRHYCPLLPDEKYPSEPQALHLMDEFARALGVTPDPSSVRFRAPRRVRRRMAQRLQEINPDQRQVIVFHPGPTWPVREWPSRRWEKLAQLISANTSAIIIKIGTDLDSMGRTRLYPAVPKTIDWTNKLDIIETVALLERAGAFVGIDSGPLHIAEVLGVPSVGLFGPIDGKLRAHPKARVTVVTSGDLVCLGCHHRPAGPLHWRTGCPHDIACMRGITPERAFAALASYMGIPVPRAETQIGSAVRSVS